MPLQQLAPQPPVTGLGDLGGVLQEAARGYATEKRQDQLLAQRRGQQLQDVREERSYQDARDQTNRMNRLADTETELKLRARQAMIASLRAEGLLNPGQENDEAAISKGYAEFKARGLETLYKDMMTTPGPDGLPFLKPGDIGNPEAVRLAKEGYGKLKAGLLQQENTAKTNALVYGQAAADRGLLGDQKLETKIDALEKEIRTPLPQPTEEEIIQRARQKYLEHHPGDKVAPTEHSKLSAEIPEARVELQNARYMAQNDRNKGLNEQVAMLKTQQMMQSQETGKLAQRNLFANPAVVAPPPPTGMGLQDGFQPLSKPSDQKDFLRFTGAQAPTAPIAGNVLANPTNNPVIARGNEAMRVQQIAQSKGTLDSLLQEKQEIDRDLQIAAQPRQVPVTVSNIGGIPTGRPQVSRTFDDPIFAGQSTSDLLKKKAVNDARLREIQAMMQGPLPVMPQAVNTATGSTPLSFASPGSMSPLADNWWKAPAQ